MYIFSEKNIVKLMDCFDNDAFYFFTKNRILLEYFN